MPTLRDVAKLARVSTCTASKVLSGDTRSRFRPHTADAVRAAAKKLGWTPDHRARSLRTGKAGAIALITPGVADSPFANAMIAAADAALRSTGTSLIMAGGDRIHGALTTGLRLAEERRVDGLLVMSWNLQAEHAAKLENAGVPVAIIGENPFGDRLATARLDDAAGLGAAVEHLAGLGHRRIAWVGPMSNSPTELAAMRRDALHRHARAAGLAVDDITVPVQRAHLPYREEVAAAAGAVRGAVPGLAATALVCFNDITANAALYALLGAGRQVPRDVSLVGFDNVLGEATWPAMTTVSHELQQLVQAAVAMLQDQSLPRLSVVTPRLVVRDSTGPAPR